MSIDDPNISTRAGVKVYVKYKKSLITVIVFIRMNLLIVPFEKMIVYKVLSW